MARYFELTLPPDGLADELGSGGERVALFLDRICRRGFSSAQDGARIIPDLATAVTMADRIDTDWLEQLDRHRSVARTRLTDAGRDGDLEAAEHVAMLVATPLLAPPDHADADALAASGALLWLIGTLVAVFLAGGDDSLSGLAELIEGGWWPIGPIDGSLLIARYPVGGGAENA